MKWTLKFWNAKAHSNFVLFWAKSQLWKFKMLTVLCSLILKIAKSKISYLYRNQAFSPGILSWGYISLQLVKLSPSFLCTVSAPFCSLLFLTLLPSECFYWHLATNPFSRRCKSPIGKSIKTSSIHSNTDLLPDNQDPAASEIMPMGGSARRVKGKGGHCVLKQEVGSQLPEAQGRDGLWPMSMLFSSGLQGKLCVSISSSSDFSNHISGIFLSSKNLLQS